MLQLHQHEKSGWEKSNIYNFELFWLCKTAFSIQKKNVYWEIKTILLTSNCKISLLTSPINPIWRLMPRKALFLLIKWKWSKCHVWSQIFIKISYKSHGKGDWSWQFRVAQQTHVYTLTAIKLGAGAISPWRSGIPGCRWIPSTTDSWSAVVHGSTDASCGQFLWSQQAPEQYCFASSENMLCFMHQKGIPAGLNLHSISDRVCRNCQTRPYISSYPFWQPG